MKFAPMLILGVCAASLAATSHAQITPDAPVQTPAPIPLQHPDDPSVLSGPLPKEPVPVTIPVGTIVSVKIVDPVDSGANKNGDMVHATLTAPVTTSKGRVLQTGTAVEATVVADAPAGTMKSEGVLSLQLTRVGGVAIISDVTEFSGQEGHKDVADSAPDKGTEAKVKAGAMMTFHVLETGAATGLDRAGAAEARREGTVGGGSVKHPAGEAAPASQAPVGSPNTTPGSGQTAAPGAKPPH